jgi:hypothetical protein
VSHVRKRFEGATPVLDALDVEGMRTKILSATVVATLALAGTAFAQTGGGVVGGGGSGGGDVVGGGGSGGGDVIGGGGEGRSGGVEPVPQDAVDRPVAVDVSILDAGGAAVDTLSCEWSIGGPGEDDATCLKFQSDPQVAFAAIESAGGVRAEQHTVVGGDDPDVAGDMAISYSKRADGTWLIRSKGTVGGTFMHFGRVCTADGSKCVRWDADGAKYARKSVARAASKLRHNR